MGFMDSVSGFLGGESSSQGASVWGEQSPFLTDIYQRGQDVSFDPTGRLYAQGFMDPSQQAFGQLAGGGFQQDLAPMQAMAGGKTPFAGFAGQQNQALEGAIGAGMRQINQNFQENIMPGINMGAVGAGTSGGSRQGIAQGLAARGANQTAADFTAKMQSDAFNQSQQRNLQAAQGQVGAQQGAFGQLGQAGQMQNQAQLGALGAAPAASNLGFGAQYGNLQNYASLVGGPTVLGGGSTSTGGVGGAIEGMAGAAYLLSDERAKENIEKVGKLDNGVNVYKYNYIGSKTPHIGVMAQEVEHNNPKAVVEIGGLKHVNYAEAVK